MITADLLTRISLFAPLPESERASLAARAADVPWPLARDPYLLEASIAGVFAAGDVRHGSIKRVSAGVGEGSMAIAVVHQYLAERRTGRSVSLNPVSST